MSQKASSQSATSPDGDVIATAADFSRSGYGGFKLWEAQRMRARDAEMDEEELEGADFEGGFDAVVQIARDALEQSS